MRNIGKFKSYVLLQLFVVYTRYLLGGAFVFASFIKIKGKRFTSASGANEPIHSAFHFFETMYQSGLYWQFLGIGQLLAGGLLMTQKYSKLGAILSITVIANIFVITISYDFAYTPVITGSMLLAAVFLILWDWNELRVLVNLPQIIIQTNTVERQPIWMIAGLILFIFTASYRIAIDYYNIFFWGIICLLIGLVSLIIWKLKYYN